MCIVQYNLTFQQNEWDKSLRFLPSVFNGVMVVVEVGARARKKGQIKPHPIDTGLFCTPWSTCNEFKYVIRCILKISSHVTYLN